MDLKPDSSQIGIAHRGLKPAAALARDKPCGTRVRYLAGCRCKACRQANSSYENARQKARRNGDWNGIVPADKARAHMRKLSRQGIGRRSIGAATDIADSILFEIRTGRRTHIRARTERKILAVTRDAAGDGALVDAGATWRLIGDLLEEGYTKSFLARRLGFVGPALQFGKRRVTVKTAHRVARLYRQLTE